MTWHLFRKRTLWLPTWRGWLLFCLVGLLGAWGLSRGALRFLGATERLPADLLVVEGWIADDALEDAAAEFRRGNFKSLVTTGGPLSKGFFLSGYGTHASLAANTLFKLGLTTNQVVAVPGQYTARGRTLEAAMAFRDWLAAHEPGVRSINLVTVGPHARRSRLTYQRVLGKRVRVGVIAVPERHYDLEHWWRSSEGLKSVPVEALAYAWSALMLWPGKP